MRDDDDGYGGMQDRGIRWYRGGRSHQLESSDRSGSMLSCNCGSCSCCCFALLACASRELERRTYFWMNRGIIVARSCGRIILMWFCDFVMVRLLDERQVWGAFLVYVGMMSFRLRLLSLRPRLGRLCLDIIFVFCCADRRSSWMFNWSRSRES